MAYAKQVEGLPCLISPQSLVECRQGIKKRINRERNRMYESDDSDYRLSRMRNIERLQIIWKELKQLEKEL